MHENPRTGLPGDRPGSATQDVGTSGAGCFGSFVVVTVWILQSFSGAIR